MHINCRFTYFRVANKARIRHILFFKGFPKHLIDKSVDHLLSDASIVVPNDDRES